MLPLILKVGQTPLAEAVAVVNRQSNNGIECTHRNWRVDTVNLVESVNQAVAALDILLVCVDGV